MENSENSLDRISNLPKEVINHILSFLPTTDVVATSLLSTRWKCLWTKVTTLDFIHVEGGTEVKAFEKFVNGVLLHMDSKYLEEFRLNWVSLTKPDPDYVTLWTSYAIARSVRVLSLQLCLLDEYELHLPIHLPATLFNCGTLEVLKIGSYFELQVPSVVCLPKLQVLVLREVLRFKSNECIPKLTRGFPVLHSLEITTYAMDEMRDIKVFSPSLRRVKIFAHEWEIFASKLEMDAPNVEYLDLYEGCSECSVKRLNSVDFVALNLDVFPRDAYTMGLTYKDGVTNGLHIDRCNSVVKLLEAMNRVRFMAPKGTLLYALSYARTPLDVCFERLTKLDVSIECCHWSSLGSVIGCSPKLQVLNITKIGCLKSSHKLSWSDPTKVPECLSSSLQKVSFVGFKGLEDEMTMIKYILQHGQVLESFTLKFTANVHDYEMVAQNLLTFPRFSQACEIHMDFD